MSLVKPLLGNMPEYADRPPILDFPMLGVGDTQDYSGNKNNGTNTNATWVAGVDGPALLFDNIDNDVTIPHTSALQFGGALPFTCIFDIVRTGDSGNNQTIVSKGNNGDPPASTFVLNIDPSTKFFKFFHEVAGSFDNRLMASTFVCELNVRYTVAIVWDGVLKHIYVDGVDVKNTNNESDPPGANTDDISLGVVLAGGSVRENNFLGEISRAVIHPRGLTDVEMLQDFNDPWAAYRKDNIVLWAAAQGAPPAAGGVNPLTGLLNFPSRLIA